MMALVLSTITTGIFAQARPQAKQLTEEQKEQMKEVKEKYTPTISELRQEMKVSATEQKVLLSSKKINEKAIYANIDKMGALKADMHKQMLAMRGEMKTICPEAGKGNGPRRGMHQNSSDKVERMHQGKSSQKGQSAQSNKGKQQRAQGKSMKQGQACQAKGSQGEQKGKGSMLKLSDEQKEQMAAIKKAHFWDIQETQNEIALLKAKNTSPEDQLKSLDQISNLQTTLAKQKMAVKLETMQVLTEEQRMMMIAKKGNQKGNNRGQKGKRARGAQQKRA